jgi:hypothetical protein
VTKSIYDSLLHIPKKIVGYNKNRILSGVNYKKIIHPIIDLATIQQFQMGSYNRMLR